MTERSDQGERYDVIVVGGGIAGLTAALYLARQDLKVLVVTMDVGGQLLLASKIQNYPGFTSIDGFGLSKKVEEQAKLYGAEFRYDEVTGVSKKGDSFTVRTVTWGELRADAIVLAFGKKPRELGVPGEQEFKGKGVSYCATCDAPLFRGKRVVLAGVGPHGVEAAGMLSDLVSELHWVFPGESPGGEEVFRSVASRPNVNVLAKSRIVEIRGEGRLSGVVVETPEGRRELQVDGVFVEMGYVPETGIVRGLVDLNENGEIIVDKLCRTSLDGVFAAGDVTDIPYKQAVISAGMGATAALSAYGYLLRRRGREARAISDWKHVDVGAEGEQEPGGGALFFAPPS